MAASSKTKICAHIECNRHATHHIGLRLRASKDGPVSQSTISLFLCHKHAIEACRTRDTILTDEAWRTIAMTCGKARMAIPRRELTELFPIPGGDVVRTTATRRQ